MNAVLFGVGLGVVIFGGWWVWAMAQPEKNCPDCGQLLPNRGPKRTGRQIFFGGWTCQNCGCELDRHGKKLSA
ncbi:MAG: hypothetical protein KC912_22420 [Proteobacteria bacterium]|nr:hypothetical protein [Pseudomonadota bacterium]